jgi:hypothetical protein
MSWLRFVNDNLRLVKDLVVGDGTPGVKSLKFDNGAISNLEIPSDSTARTWQLPPTTGQLAIVSQNSLKSEIFNHFLASIGDFLSSVAGTGSTVTFNGVADSGGVPGMITLGTGTTASGRTYVGTSVSAIQLGFGFCKTECRIRLPNLSTATETYTVRFGFLNSSSGESSNGLFARYTHSVNNGNWQFVSRINGVEQTPINTNIPPTTSAWQRLFIDIASDGTAGSLYINGDFIGTLGNLGGLAIVGRQVGVGVFILKSLGITTSALQMDYLYCGINV